MKVFISVPMRGRTDEEIAKAIEIAKSKLSEMAQKNQEYIIYVDNFVSMRDDTDIKDPAMYCLGGAIQKMSKCDAIYFCPGWDEARGCIIERQVAIQYGLMRLYQDDETGIIFQESVE